MKTADQALYQKASVAASAAITHTYSTSFGWAIRLLPSKQRQAIYGIYGFVRLADELVDSYPAPAAGELLKRLRHELKAANLLGVSVNPIVQSYIEVVLRYEIDSQLTEAFLHSMEMDIEQRRYTKAEYETYIYGSAEVVGLMCLKVFVGATDYIALAPAAQKLGSAFQKVNFLRDFASDYKDRERVYFPGVTFKDFDDNHKKAVEQDIIDDIMGAVKGLNQLPWSSRLAVALATSYYLELLERLRAVSAQDLRQKRIRVPNWRKLIISLRVLFAQGLLHRPLQIKPGQPLPSSV